MTKRYEQVVYPDRIIFILPVRRSRLTALEIMLQTLYHRWIKEHKLSVEKVISDRQCRQMMRDIANLFPLLNNPEKWGFPVNPLFQDPEQIRDLFLAQVNDKGEYISPRLVDLNHFDPISTTDPDLEENEDDIDEGLIIPSSGNPDIDLLANLSCAFDIKGAFDLLDRLDAQEIDQYSNQIRELKRDPDERRKEALAEDYGGWKEENYSDFREGLGITFRLPSKEEEHEPSLT